MRTYSVKPGEIKRDWILIDARGLVVGRLASVIADRIRGKHKPIYTPHMDCGDNVIVINAGEVVFTGSKRMNKVYHRHTGYPGGIKSVRAVDVLEGANPERVIKKAVERMVPRGPLGRKQLRKLYVYAGDSHRHHAQKPRDLDVTALDSRMRRSVA